MNAKIKTREAVFFMLTLFLLHIPASQYINATWGLLDDLLRCVSAMIVLMQFFFQKRKKLSTSIITAILIIMMGELLLSTVINGGDLKAWFVAAASVIALGMLFEISLARSDTYINSMMLLMESLSYIHLLLILLFPRGLYEINGGTVYWLFGQKNMALPYLLIAYIAAFCYGYAGGSIFREIGVYMAGIISSILVHSSTSTVGLILLAALFLLVRKGVKFNAYTLLGINVGLFLILTIFRLQLPVFKYFIENILHKNVTMGRDILWDMALYYIRKQPLLGYGLYGSNPKGFSTFGETWNLYAHNQILQELFDGGAVQLLLYSILLLLIYHRLNKYHDRMFVQCMIVALFALNIMFITEAYRNKIVYLVYYYAYYAPNIETILLNKRRKGKKNLHTIVLPQKRLSGKTDS